MKPTDKQLKDPDWWAENVSPSDVYYNGYEFTHALDPSWDVIAMRPPRKPIPPWMGDNHSANLSLGAGPTAHDIVSAALSHMQDRATTYDSPKGERSMTKTVKAFNALSGLEMTTEQGWLFMICLKAARTQQGDFKADNYEDGAAYFGLMGEEGAGS